MWQLSLYARRKRADGNNAADGQRAGRSVEREGAEVARVAFSGAVDQIRGKVGTNVFSAARSGPTVRIRRSPKASNTPAQAAIKRALSKSSRTFKTMSVAQVAAWRTYANGITRTNPLSGDVYHPAPIDAFNELAIKFLQINPTGTVPLTPPAVAFEGDTITVSVAASAGVVTFTANAGNLAAVRTELLLASIASPHRTVTPDDYRTMGFHLFATGALNKAYAVPAGWYAPAYRFVNPATGQMLGIVPLPIIQVT
jgi:hypothetical protein